MKKHKIWLSIVILTVSLLSFKATSNDFGLMQSTETVIRLMRELSENYVDEVDTKAMLKNAALGMTSTLDPYSSFLAEEDMGDFQIMTTGKYGGIGSVIRQKGDYVVVAQPYKGSPAAKAGLRVGDKFLKIGGENAVGMTTAQASEKLKGTPGTKLKVEVRPIEDTTTVRKITITRERIKIPAISYAGFVGNRADSIGYIAHADFSEDSYAEMTQALSDMQREGLKGLVLDYRGNGGGLMQEAINVLSLFLPKGSEVLKIKGRRDSMIFKTTHSPRFEHMPLVVLIDGNSASASEIVAGALQDLDRAVLVGQRSFGKGLVQSTVPLGYNTMLKLTTARYYIPSGRCIQAVDYSKGASAADKTVDSLKQEFSTRSGRKVYDGGGIAPDVTTSAEYVSRFAVMLYALGVIEEFCDDYFVRHLGEEFSAAGFSISDDEYAEFEKFVEKRDIPYKSRTRTLLEELKKAANEERYSSELIEKLEQELRDDKLTNLDTYRKEITKYINNDIILRHGYMESVIKNSLTTDTDVARAVELLNSPEEWQRSLESHNEGK